MANNKKNNNKKEYNRYIKTKNKYDVWVQNRGECNFCSKELLSISDTEDGCFMENIGQIAHILSHSPKKKERNRKNKLDIIDKRFEKCKSFREHKDPWSDQKQEYIDEAINCCCNITLLCKDCHGKFDNGYYNHKINDYINNIITNENVSESYYKEIYNFIDINVKKKKNSKEFNDIRPLITIFKRDDKGNIKNNNIDSILNIVKDMDPKATIIINPFSNNLYDFKKIYNDFYSKYNLKTVEDIKDKETGWKEFKQSILSINEENYVAKFTYRKEDDNSPTSWWITFEKKDFYDLEKEIKNNELLKKNIDNFIKKENNSYLSRRIYKENFSNANDKLKSKPEFEIISNILMNQLNEFSLNENKKEFDSFSIAYFARWGTGKTSLIRTITKELKDFYNSVEINLWNISNIVADETKNKDDSFVRHIVKESITQLVNNPNYVKMYVDSNKSFSSSKDIMNLKNEMINSLIGIKEENNVNVIEQRSKFVDQFLMNLQNAITSVFELTLKPTIFIFDDIDRINESDKIVKILDSIVTFLNLKNCVFIFPVDESKIIKAINEKKPNLDPLQYINKYFNYSVRSSFIPKIDNLPMIKEQISELDFNLFGKKENTLTNINENLIKIIANFIESSHRATKDFSNSLSFNTYSLIKNITSSKEMSNFFNSLFEGFKYKYKDVINHNQLEYILLFSSASTIIQSKYPLIIDFVSEDIDNLRKLIEFCKLYDSSKTTINIPDEVKEEDNNHDDNYSNEIASKIITNIMMAKCKAIVKYIENPNSLDINIYSIESGYLRDKEWLKKFKMDIHEKIIELSNIFKKFHLLDLHADEVLILWLALTLSKIESKVFLNYAKSSIAAKEILSKEEFDSFTNDESWQEHIVNFFGKIDDFTSSNLIKEEEEYTIINNLLDDTINEIISSKMSNENKKQLYSIETISRLIESYIDSNEMNINEDNNVNKIINCINNYELDESFKSAKKKVSISSKTFSEIINNIKNLKANDFIFNKFIIKDINDNQPITCKKEVDLSSFIKINKMVNNKIKYNLMPKIDIYSKDLFNNISLINIKDIKWDKIVESILNSNAGKIEDILSIDNEYYEEFINWLSNNIGKYVDAISYDDLLKIINKNIIAENKNLYILSLINIFNKGITKSDNIEIDDLLKWIADNVSILDIEDSEIKEQWDQFISNIFSKQNDEFLSETTKSISKILNNNHIDDEEEQSQIKNTIFYLIYSYINFTNDKIINNNLKEIKKLDDILDSNKLKELTLSKLNKFTKELSYEGMTFYKGSNIEDITEYNMVYNESEEYKQIQEDLLLNYIDNEGTNFYLMYEDSEKSLEEFIKNVKENMGYSDEIIYNPKFIINEDYLEFNDFLEEHYSNCLTKNFLNIDCDGWTDFIKWYENKKEEIDEISLEYKEKYLSDPDYNKNVNEFINYYSEEIKDFNKKSYNIENWFNEEIHISNKDDLDKFTEEKNELIKNISNFLCEEQNLEKWSSENSITNYVMCKFDELSNSYSYLIQEAHEKGIIRKNNKLFFLLNQNNYDKLCDSYSNINQLKDDLERIEKEIELMDEK